MNGSVASQETRRILNRKIFERIKESIKNLFESNNLETGHIPYRW